MASRFYYQGDVADVLRACDGAELTVAELVRRPGLPSNNDATRRRVYAALQAEWLETVRDRPLTVRLSAKGSRALQLGETRVGDATAPPPPDRP